MAWSLTVGSEDVTSVVQQGATFTEIASSAQGQANFGLLGNHLSCVPGASVTLTDMNGNLAWEGTVSVVNPHTDGQSIISLMVMAVPLSAQLAQTTTYGSQQNNDIASLASGLLASTNFFWGGPSAYGIEVGGLTFSQIDTALTTLASLGGYSWRVQNGQVVFTGAQSGFQTLSFPLQTTPNSLSSVIVRGGADPNRIPLLSQASTGAQGPVGNITDSDIGDIYTLNMLANAVAREYGSGAIQATALVSNLSFRAGDWFVDSAGVTAPAWKVQWQLNQGIIQALVNFGYPQLPSSPVYSQAFNDQMHRYPVARLASDYIVQGGDLSISGLTASLTKCLVVLGDTLSIVNAGSVTLPATGVSVISATSSAFTISQNLSAPAPGSAIQLWRVTTINGVIAQQLDLRARGGVGTNHVQPNAITLNALSGDTSGDKSTAIINAATKTFNHPVMSQPVLARILADNTLKVDGTTGPVSGNLPYSNHDAAFRNRILSDNTLKVDGTTGPVSGNLPYLNHHTALTDNWDSSSKLKSTANLFTNAFNLGQWQTNASLASSWPLNSTTLTYYIDDGGLNGGSPSFWRGDVNNASNTTPAFTAPNIGNYTAGTGGVLITGLDTSKNVYFTIYYKVGDTTGVNGTGWHVSWSQSIQGLGSGTLLQPYADGGPIAVYATAKPIQVGNNTAGPVFKGGGGGKVNTQ